MVKHPKEWTHTHNVDHGGHRIQFAYAIRPPGRKNKPGMVQVHEGATSLLRTSAPPGHDEFAVRNAVRDALKKKHLGHDIMFTRDDKPSI